MTDNVNDGNGTRAEVEGTDTSERATVTNQPTDAELAAMSREELVALEIGRAHV